MSQRFLLNRRPSLPLRDCSDGNRDDQQHDNEDKRYIVGFNFFKKDCVRLIFLRGASAGDQSGLLEGDYADGRRLALFHSADEVKTKRKEFVNITKTLLKLIRMS